MEFINFIQQISNPFFDFLFQAITFIGEDVPMVILMAIVFWCINREKGLTLAILLSTSMGINDFFKNIIRMDRPSVLYGDSIRVLREHTATGYSTPSGHTQVTATAYFGIAKIFNKKWLFVLASILSILVAISRMYLGAHTLLDTSLALIIALICVFGIGILIDKLIRYIRKTGKFYFYFVFLIPTLFMIIALFPLFHTKPAITEDTFKIIGLSIGITSGIYVCEKYFPYKAYNGEKGIALVKMVSIKLSVGLIGGLIIKLLFELLPEINIAVFLQYGLVGFWFCGFMSWFIYKLNKNN